MPGRFLSGILLAAVTLALLVMPAAAAGEVQCGEVVTHDITLDHDLTGCAGDGLVVGAHGVTVNLNGHLIEGTGPGNGSDVIYGDTRDGVDNAAGYRGVTIENGEIRKFDTGVKLYEADSNRVTGLDSHGNLVGIIAVESSDNRIDANDAHQDGFGLYLVESGGNRVSGNMLDANTFGLYLVESSGNTIWRNSSQGSGILGFEITKGSDGNVVMDNTILVSNGPGLLMSVSVANSVEGNLIRDHRGGGVVLSNADRTRLARNTVENRSFDQGTLPAGTSGVQIFVDSDDVTLDRNLIAGYPHGVVVQSSAHATLSRNDLRGGVGDGITVVSGAPGAVLDRNTTTLFGDDGIDVEDGSVAVSRNVANRNGDYGIEAVPGVDRGGNKAAGNGNPGQCLNVSCK
jgi:parallel beta-helix repeat protein